MDPPVNPATTLSLADGWRVTLFPCDVEPAPTPDEWRRFLGQLARSGPDLPGATPLKVSASVEVFRVPVPAAGGALGVVCKSARGRGLLQRLRRRLVGSRERRAARRALRLLELGIPTARPLALLERGGEPAWLVSEFVPDLLDFEQLALRLHGASARDRWRLKRRLTAALLELLVRLDGAGLRHRDFKAGNLLVRGGDLEDEQTVPQVWLLDLDGLHAGRGPLLRELTRLAASLDPVPVLTRTDRYRVLRSYLRTRGEARRARGLFIALDAAIRRYRASAAARHSGRLDALAD